jgi:hypothetical protein
MSSNLTLADIVLTRKFSFRELLSITKCTRKQIDRWTTEALIVVDRPGSGYTRDYTFANLVEAGVASELMFMTRSLELTKDAMRQIRRCCREEKLTARELYLGYKGGPEPQAGMEPYLFSIDFGRGVTIGFDQRRRELVTVSAKPVFQPANNRGERFNDPDELQHTAWLQSRPSVGSPNSRCFLNVTSIASELAIHAQTVLA